MAPGVFCRDGFLGTDNRPLEDILDADRSAVESLGTTHERIAAGLAAILDAAMAAQGAEVSVGDGENLRAVYLEAMGRIPSPFGDGVWPKGEVELTDTRTGGKYFFTPLSVNLIAAHGFYQGRGSRYRIEPDAICRILGIV